MSPKHIGIASVTAEGGALAFRHIVHISERILGRDQHPEISLHSHSFSKFSSVTSNRDQVWSALITESSRKLASAGAEFFICPANTNHSVFDVVQETLAIPWLHIASMVAEHAHSRGYRKCLLLGTRYLLESGIYPAYFEPKGIEVLIPDEASKNTVQQIIYEELIRGIVSTEARAFVVALIKKYSTGGQCDSVVLGCTELPMLIAESDADIPTLDTTNILACGAVAAALGITLANVEADVEANVEADVERVICD